MQQQEQTNDLEILFPDREFVLAGEKLTMRELTFKQQLNYHHLLEPLYKNFDVLLSDDLGDNETNTTLDFLFQYPENTVNLMAICLNKPVEWIEQLSSEDAEILALYWWAMNKGFFIRRAWRRTQTKIIKATAQAGEESLQPLSEQAITSEKLTTIPTDK